MNNLAEIHRGLEEHAIAEWHYRSTILDRSPPVDAPALVATLNNLATLYSGMGAHSKAESAYRRALALLHEAKNDHGDLRITVLANLAQFYVMRRRYVKAADFWEAAVRAAEGSGPRSGAMLPNLLRGYADALRRLKRAEEATVVEQRLTMIRKH